MKIKLIDYGYTNAPYRAHYSDAGSDVYTLDDITIGPNKTYKVPLGFGIALPDGLAAWVVPRSGHASRGIVTELAPIDSGYTGEIHAIVSNLNDHEIKLEKNTRIAQLVITPIIIADYVDEVGEERGPNGFGSTKEK